MYLLNKDDQWGKSFSDKPRPRRKVKLYRSEPASSLVQGRRFFTAAPLYVDANVNYSLPDQFEGEFGEKERIIVDYQREVIGGLGAWGSLIEGIDETAWDDFCKYVMTTMFISRAKGLIWQVRYKEIDVEDPIERTIVNTASLPIRLRIFLPDGNKARMAVRAGCPAKLRWIAPQQDMIDAAKAILSCKGKLNEQ